MSDRELYLKKNISSLEDVEFNFQRIQQKLSQDWLGVTDERISAKLNELREKEDEEMDWIRDNQRGATVNYHGVNVTHGPFPHENPKKWDMWVDTGQRPPLWHRWDGARWDKITRNYLEEMEGGIGSTQIKPGAVLTPHLAANTIESYHISTAGLDAGVITSGTVSSDRLYITGRARFQRGYDPSEKETPEGAQLKVDELESKVEGNITDLENDIGDLETTIDGLEGDLTKAEAKQVRQHKNDIEASFKSIQKRYDKIYHNQWLDDETSLKSSLSDGWSDFNDSHDALVSKIDSILTNKEITDSDRDDLDLLTDDYGDKLGTLSDVLEDAVDKIGENQTDAKVGDLENSLGDLSWEDAVEKALLGSTIIEGGYIVTDLLNADRIKTGTLEADRLAVIPDSKIDSSSYWSGKADPGDWDSDVESAKNDAKEDIAQSMNFSNYDNMVTEFSEVGSTIIDGGVIRTNLIESSVVVTDAIHAGQAWFGELDAVYGTFTDLLTGDSLGSRIELGLENDEPFLKMFNEDNELHGLVVDPTGAWYYSGVDFYTNDWNYASIRNLGDGVEIEGSGSVNITAAGYSRLVCSDYWVYVNNTVFETDQDAVIGGSLSVSGTIDANGAIDSNNNNIIADSGYVRTYRLRGEIGTSNVVDCGTSGCDFDNSNGEWRLRNAYDNYLHLTGTRLSTYFPDSSGAAQELYDDGSINLSGSRNMYIVPGGTSTSGNAAIFSSSGTTSTTSSAMAIAEDRVRSGAIYDFTVSDANDEVMITSTPNIGRLSSSAKLKSDIEYIEPKYAENFINNSYPRWYRRRYPTEDDNPNHSFFGFVAEDLVDVEPRLVTYDQDGEPRGVAHRSITALLHAGIREDRKKIKRLEEELEKVKEKIKGDETKNE